MLRQLSISTVANELFFLDTKTYYVLAAMLIVLDFDIFTYYGFESAANLSDMLLGQQLQYVIRCIVSIHT